MDNVVSINHTKENVIEFDLTMEGVESKDVDVRFMVESKGMELCFKAAKKEKNTWFVKLPKLPMLERTAYKFTIEVHADGYFFKVFNGTLNVVGSAEIYSSEPKNVTLKPTKSEDKQTDKEDDKTSKSKDKDKKEEKKVQESSRPREKSIEQIAREMMERNKSEGTSNEKPVTKPAEKIVEKVEPKADKKPENLVGKVWGGHTDDQIEEIARNLLEGKDFSAAALDEKVKEVREAAKDPANSKDAKVLEILESAGITLKRNKKRRFSLH